ncbi:MAG: nucleoside deaminase [Ignavibacteriaceae bacterium]|nr:nucleoside deaminase [Ignavibacteriaceae bacterium]
MFSETDNHFMEIALREAVKAFDAGEVPVGCVIVKENRILGKGYNQVKSLKDPTAHAEIIAITAAANSLESEFLTGCKMYSTLEPCVMCAGAIISAKIDQLFFAAFEGKTGACGSIYNITGEGKLNHTINVISGLKEYESKSLLKEFFRLLRNGNINTLH